VWASRRRPPPTTARERDVAPPPAVRGTRSEGRATVSRLPSLGPRGEGWVGLQAILLVLVGISGTLGPTWDGDPRLATSLAGAILLAAGGLLATRGLTDLRDALTPLPHPRPDASLVEHGAYRLVRHPIYGGIVVGAAGFGLVTASPAALVGAGILLAFFDLKSRREETWLEARYPAYPAYRRRTRRLLPFLY
jgi:protein-S-isoprenylcysteine O-methyltransferase Ste14